MTEQARGVAEGESLTLSLQPLACAAGAGDEHLELRTPSDQWCKGSQEQVEALLRLQPADGDDCNVVRRERERVTRRETPPRVAPEAAGVDAVEDDRDAILARAVSQQLVAHVTRHCDDLRIPGEQPLVQRIVEPSFASGMARPAMSGRQWHRTRALRQHPREDI